MSVAGIFASSLFSDAMSQLGQKSPSAAKQPASGSSFAALQQELTSQSSPLTLADSITANFPQLGSQLLNQSGIKLPTQTPPSRQPSSQIGTAGREATLSTSPLAAAWQAYNSLQQNPVNAALGNSLQANSAGISINI